MANYYTKLSFEIEGTAEQITALQIILDEEPEEEDEDGHDPEPSSFVNALFKSPNEDESGHGCETALSEDGCLLWISSDEDLQADKLADLLALWMKEQDIDTPLGFEYSFDCSKPRTDAYGGGACYIGPRGDSVEFMTTGEWLAARKEAPCE